MHPRDMQNDPVVDLLLLGYLARFTLYLSLLCVFFCMYYFNSEVLYVFDLSSINQSINRQKGFETSGQENTM